MPVHLMGPTRTQWLKRLLGAFLLFINSASPYAADLIAFTENKPPLNYEENGVAKGYSVAVVNALAAEAGMPVQIKFMPWARAYYSAVHNADSLIFTMVRNPEREDLFIWLGPIATRTTYLYRLTSRTDIVLPNLAAAKKYSIGTVRESASAKQLIGEGFQVNKELDMATDDVINFKKLIAGRIDLLASLDLAARYSASQAGRNPNLITPALLLDNQHDYYIGLSKASNPNPALVLNLQTAFEKLKKNGTLKQLQQQYFGSNKP